MSILVTPETKVLIQGITGSFGARHAKLSLAYGTKVVAGVTPGRGGQNFENQVPIFDTVSDAVRETGATASAVFVPPAFAADAILEAVDAGLELVVAITEGELHMGPWEHIFYYEFDGRRRKRVLVKIIGE